MRDENTGLPKVLQEGDYFKLVPSSVRPWMELKYMRPNKYWFDRTIERITIIMLPGEILHAPELVRKAELLLADVEWVLRQEERDREVRKELAERKKPTREEKAKKRTQVKEDRRRIKLAKKRNRELQASVEEENSKFYGKYPPKSLNS